MGRFTVYFRLFTFTFTQAKVKKVGMPHRVNFTSQKKLSSLKKAIVKLASL